MSAALTTLRTALERAAAVRPKAGGFPYLAEVLRQAGVSRCRMAVPSNAMLYLTASGPVVVQEEPLCTGPVEAPPFDRAALITALRADQAGETEFPEFVRGAGRPVCSGTTSICTPAPAPTTEPRATATPRTTRRSPSEARPGRPPTSHRAGHRTSAGPPAARERGSAARGKMLGPTAQRGPSVRALPCPAVML